MGAEAIGNLYASLGLDTGQFDTKLDRTTGRLQTFGKINFTGAMKAGVDELGGSLQSAAGQAGAFGSILSGLGIGGVAVAAGLAVAFNGARDAMAFGDDIADTANKLKVTTDYLQEMRYTAHGLGGDFQDADDAIEAFTKNFGLATSGLSAKAVKPFEALGLDPKSFATTQEALDAVIAKIAGLGSAAEQAAVADKLGLTPMLPAIREGTAAIDEMRQAAHEIGYVMDADLIEKAGEANDKFESLTAVLDVQFKSAMVEAIPLVMQLTQMMVDGAKWAGDFASNLNDAAAAFDRLSTHDLSGNDVGNARNKLFARIQQQQASQQASSISGWLNPNYDRVLPGQAHAAGNLSSVLGKPKEKPEELQDLQGRNERLAAARKAAGEAARLAAAAERERAAALRAESDAIRNAEQKSADYLAGLMEEVGTMGMSTEALKRRKIELEAAAAPTEALANQIRALGAQYVAQAKVGEEAAAVQRAIKDQTSETITTINDAVGAGAEYKTVLSEMAERLGVAADMSQAFAYDLEGIAHAINGNDWTSALSGLANVLGRVDKAFKSAKTSQDKYAAVAALAQGVGTAVGGTGGAALSGAGSGALAGLGAASALTTLGLAVPGPGWALAAAGAVLGGLGGIFGSSKAKKQAKAQAKAEAEAKEQQRQQQIADIRFQQQVDLLRAQGKEQEAVNMERQHELDALRALDSALVAGQQALYDAADAATAKAEADAIAAEAEQHRLAVASAARDLQDRIDELTLSASDLLAKKRDRERAAYVAVDAALGDQIDQLYALEDAATASADATARARGYTDYLADVSSQAAAAMDVQAEAMSAWQDVVRSTSSSLEGLTQSLREFASELGDQLGLSGDGYDAARANLLANKSSPYDVRGNIDAFLKSSQARYGDSQRYLRDVALSRSIAMQAAESAAWASSHSSYAQVMGGLPGFANGGSFTFGGNPGVDQNVLSLNGSPIANVSYGETAFIGKGSANDNGMAAVVAKLEALRQDVVSLKSVSQQTADNTKETHDFLRNGVVTTVGA